MQEREPLRERAQGKWHHLFPALGVHLKPRPELHGPCPMCGGKDRFRMDNKGGYGTWICNQCGAGDGVGLVMQVNRIDFREAAEMIERELGEAPTRQFTALRQAPPSVAAAPPGPPDRSKAEACKALWSRAVPIEPHHPAGLYLNARCGLTAFPAALRFATDERYSEVGSRPTYHPAMVAKVDPSDEAFAAGARAAIHRTYLTRDGEKADVASVRKMLGDMPAGAAVRLMPPTGDGLLGVGEGIESCLSAAAIFNVPVWSTLTAGLLREWTPPEGVQKVFVFGDNDHSYTGQAAAYALAMRLRAKGLTVIVELPPVIGTDWNDVHLENLERDR